MRKFPEKRPRKSCDGVRDQAHFFQKPSPANRKRHFPISVRISYHEVTEKRSVRETSLFSENRLPEFYFLIRLFSIFIDNFSPYLRVSVVKNLMRNAGLLTHLNSAGTLLTLHWRNTNDTFELIHHAVVELQHSQRDRRARPPVSNTANH